MYLSSHFYMFITSYVRKGTLIYCCFLHLSCFKRTFHLKTQLHHLLTHTIYNQLHNITKLLYKYTYILEYIYYFSACIKYTKIHFISQHHYLQLQKTKSKEPKYLKINLLFTSYVVKICINCKYVKFNCFQYG